MVKWSGRTTPLADVNIDPLDWQREVMLDPARFKVIAAGRRTGKSYLAAFSLILAALNDKPGKVFYVAPTYGQARDVMWDVLWEIAGNIITSQNINNLELTLAGGNKIYLKGSDRPDTLRGVSLKHLVLDEYAFMKPDVWESILRPALSDRQGTMIAIGTPEGRNHFYEMYLGAENFDNWSNFHFTSYDNPKVKKEEIEHARSTLPNYAFQQEYMASFDAKTQGNFKPESFDYYDERPPGRCDVYIAIDLAGFKQSGQRRSKKRDDSAIAIVYVDGQGHWWVEDIQYGQWSLEETVQNIFRAVEAHKPTNTGVEKGIAQQAVFSPLKDAMRRTHRVFRLEPLSHGNQRKEDRILWALAGRFENGMIHLKRGPWNNEFEDQAGNFPSLLVHDDLLDALAYVDQMAQVPYFTGFDQGEDDWDCLDAVAGY